MSRFEWFAWNLSSTEKPHSIFNRPISGSRLTGGHTHCQVDSLIRFLLKLWIQKSLCEKNIFFALDSVQRKTWPPFPLNLFLTWAESCMVQSNYTWPWPQFESRLPSPLTSKARHCSKDGAGPEAMGRGPRPSPALGAREGRYLGRLRANRARSNIVNNYTNNIRIWQVFYCHFTGDIVITVVAFPAVTR